MDFGRSEKIEEMITLVRDFMQKEVYPLENDFRYKSFKDMVPKLEVVRQKVKQLGLWAPPIEEEWGGAGLSLTEFAHLSEELGRSPIGHYVFNCQAPDIGNMELMLGCANEEQKEKWLKPLIQGDIRSCFSMTEPEFAGSNPTRMATSARLEDGNWVVNGHKWFTSSAEGSAFAIVMAVTDPEVPSDYAKASMIIVPTDTPGFELIRNISVMGHAGSDYASHAEIMYQQCKVPEGNLLGARGAGFVLAQERLGPGRIHHCMRWIGICERAMDLMCTYAAERELVPGKPLGSRQTIQNWIAESRAEINGARLMVLQAAWKIDKEGTYAAREEISLIKFTVANVMQRVLDRAIQVHGGLGVTDDTPLAFWYGHERAARIYDGPDEVHKAVVAKRILRKYGIKAG